MVRILTVDCIRVKPRHKRTPTAVAQVVGILSLPIARTTHLLGVTIPPNTRRTTTMVAAVEEGKEHKLEEQEPEDQEPEEQAQEPQEPEE